MKNATNIASSLLKAPSRILIIYRVKDIFRIIHEGMAD